MSIKPVYTDKAPKPSGHYSQAVIYNDTVYVAGLLAIDAEGKKHIDASVTDQTRLIFKNMNAILRAAGSNLERLLSVTIYVSDINDWGEINEVYEEIMGNHIPARAIVPVRDLHYGLKLEIQAIAAA